MRYLRDAWLVLVLALGFGAALAGVQAQLSGRIAANKLDETLGTVSRLVPGATRGEAVEMAGRTVYKAMDEQGTHVGWVLPAGGQGFADRVELLVGLSADLSKITGLYVLDQKETPGLGDKIRTDGWRKQFEGLSPIQPIGVTKVPPASGNQVVAITGATISSQSVAAIVNTDVQWLSSQLASQGASK